MLQPVDLSVLLNTAGALHSSNQPILLAAQLFAALSAGFDVLLLMSAGVQAVALQPSDQDDSFGGSHTPLL